MATTPPVEFLPNSEPCGPFKTSMREMSTKSEPVMMPDLARYTPSTKVATVGSNPMLNTEVPNPRMAKEVPCEGGSTARISRDGTTLRRSKMSMTTLVVSCSPEIAVTEMGTSCMDSTRFCAVTMTSSNCAAWALPAAAATASARTLAVLLFI